MQANGESIGHSNFTFGKKQQINFPEVLVECISLSMYHITTAFFSVQTSRGSNPTTRAPIQYKDVVLPV